MVEGTLPAMALRRWLSVSVLLAACNDDAGRFFPPADDGASNVDATATDIVATDTPATDIVAADARDAVTVDRRAPVDLGPNNCPSGCASNSDCAPCASRSGELFCCVSGLCVFTSEPMCVATPDGGGVMPDADAGGDGGDGAAPDTSGNPFDDVPDPGSDGGMPMPDDAATPPMDAAPADAAGDVVNDLARADAAG